MPGALDQLLEADAERVGELKKGCRSRVALAALDPTHVAVKPA